MDEFIIMPNHVHGIVILFSSDVGAGLKPAHSDADTDSNRAGLKPAPTKQHGLSEIVRAFKTYSARRINEIRNTPSLPVWQRNYYERIIRNEDELNRIHEYIINNPLQWAEDENNPMNLKGLGNGDNGWKTYTLGELIDIKHGFAFQGEFFRDEPTMDLLLTPGNFAIGGGFKSDKFKYYAGPVPEDFVLEEGDLLITMTDLSKNADTLGYPAIVPKSKGVHYLHNQRLGKVLIYNNNLLRKDFLYYLLCTREYRHEVLASATGTTVKHTSPDRIKAFRFSLPPLPEQKAIASILGALDDKIELKRKMNETLEAMARAIFKSGFTYPFEGIKYLQGEAPSPLPSPNGRGCQELTGEGELELVDSPLGKIPKGWRVGSLKEIAELQRESISPMNFPDEIFDHYSIPAFDDGQMPTQDLGTTIRSNKFLLPEQCILISKLNPRIPGIWFPKINKTQRSVASTEFLVLIPTSPYTSEFIYSLCASTSFQDTFISLVTGTSSSHQRVKPDDLSNMEVVCPPDIAMKGFNQRTQPLFVQIQTNKEQSRTLASIRDALLPKLLSGELRISGTNMALESNT